MAFGTNGLKNDLVVTSLYEKEMIHILFEEKVMISNFCVQEESCVSYPKNIY